MEEWRGKTGNIRGTEELGCWGNCGVHADNLQKCLCVHQSVHAPEGLHSGVWASLIKKLSYLAKCVHLCVCVCVCVGE